MKPMSFWTGGKVKAANKEDIKVHDFQMLQVPRKKNEELVELLSFQRSKTILPNLRAYSRRQRDLGNR